MGTCPFNYGILSLWRQGSGIYKVQQMIFRHLYEVWNGNYWSKKSRIRNNTQGSRKIHGVQIYSLYKSYLKSHFFHSLLNFLPNVDLSLFLTSLST